MKAVTQAIYTTLAADVALTAKIAKYPSQQADAAPAIFTQDVVPDNALRPYIHVRPLGGRLAVEAKDHHGREQFRDVAAFVDRKGNDPLLVEEIADLIYSRFDRQLLAVAGWSTILTHASEPVVAPTDDTIFGRIVTVRVVLVPL